MKRLIIINTLLFCALACFGQASIKFDKTVQHLGFITQGDTVSFQYTFTNTGNQPLIISDSKVECGCTMVEIPKQPVQPNTQGVVKVKFNTKSAIDRQDRTITLTCNASNTPPELRFKCVVLKPKKKT